MNNGGVWREQARVCKTRVHARVFGVWRAGVEVNRAEARRVPHAVRARKGNGSAKAGRVVLAGKHVHCGYVCEG